MNDLQHFTPAPTRKRISGWTVQKQLEFIRHLAAFGSVRDAARSVGMAESSAYRLRARFGAEAFCKAWDMALYQAGNHLLAVAVDRALHGSRREYWKDGKLIGTQVAPSDKLLIYTLERLKPPQSRWQATPQEVEKSCANFIPHEVIEEEEEGPPQAPGTTPLAAPGR